MTAESGAVVAVRMPQVNVNDEEVTVLEWRVPDGGRAEEGRPLCEIETSKAVGELPSPATGIVRHVAKSGEVVRVDAIVAYLGPSAEAVDSYLSMLGRPGPGKSVPLNTGGVPASAGAVELAQAMGVDLSMVQSSEGRIRRADVERYLAERAQVPAPPLASAGRTSGAAAAAVADDVLPEPLRAAVDEVDALPNHQWAMTQHLQQTQERLVVAHALMDVNMSRALAWINQLKQAGQMASPLPVLIKAAARAIGVCPNLQAFRMHRRVFRYRQVDIAFTARSHQGWLYTPVVRDAGQLALPDLAARCGELAMAAFRGQLVETDLAGSCLTVSLLNEQPVRLHVGLQNTYQTALLTSGAIREELRLVEGRPVAVPMITLVLSYDHGLLDGWDAAAALDAARRSIEEWSL